MHELSISTTKTYANPYIDVSLNATFTYESKSILVYGFWDGSKTWKIRFTPPNTGVWNYLITSNDSDMNGLNGNFNVISTEISTFIKRDDINKYAFSKNNNTIILLIGDTNWNSMSDRAGTLTNSIFKQYIDIRASQKFNFIRSYIVPFYISTNSANYNEGGRAFEPWNPDTINPLYFQEADKRIKYATSKGITINLLLGSDGTNITSFFGYNSTKLDRYIKYICARYGAYNISWEGRAEFEEQGTPTQSKEVANFIGNKIELYDSHKHIQSMHTIDSNNELGNELWLDWIMHQGNGLTKWNLIISDKIYNKPVMNEEFYYENSGNGATHAHHVDADTMRKEAWTLMTYGASGLAYGNTGTYNSRSQPFAGIQYATSPGANYMTYLHNFFNATELWKMTPKHNLASSGYLLGTNQSGKDYVIYLPNGGSTTVDLSSLPGLLQLEWYNPRTGTYQGQTTVQGGAQRTFTSPDTDDWILHIYCPTPLCDFTITIT